MDCESRSEVLSEAATYPLPIYFRFIDKKIFMNLQFQIKLIDDLVAENSDTTIKDYLEVCEDIKAIESTDSNSFSMISLIKEMKNKMQNNLDNDKNLLS